MHPEAIKVKGASFIVRSRPFVFVKHLARYSDVMTFEKGSCSGRRRPRCHDNGSLFIRLTERQRLTITFSLGYRSFTYFFV